MLVFLYSHIITMKKTLLGLTAFLLWLFSFFTITHASNYENSKEKANIIITTIENKQNFQPEIQPQGVKSRFVKKTIKLVASALRNTSDDILKGVLKNRVEPKTVKKIINTKYKIADVLDDIALPLDYASTAIHTAVYQAIVPYLWHDIAWGISGLVEFLLF